VLGLTLDLIEGVTQGKKNGNDSAAGMCGKCWVAMLFAVWKA
jgi:hypothetical protein